MPLTVNDYGKVTYATMIKDLTLAQSQAPAKLKSTLVELKRLGWVTDELEVSPSNLVAIAQKTIEYFEGRIVLKETEKNEIFSTIPCEYLTDDARRWKLNRKPNHITMVFDTGYFWRIGGYICYAGEANRPLREFLIGGVKVPVLGIDKFNIGMFEAELATRDVHLNLIH